MSNNFIIYALTYLVFINVVNSRFVALDITKQWLETEPNDSLNKAVEALLQKPIRVKRSAIVYNKCPLGFKRMPPPLLCVSCEQYETITGDPC
ncbi:unnamed protein product [Parnassius apollo]|uniref:(apollo) hypothetical protein n=1 Tax=Parnassius apollo TaxID=110799 RepID=A0A8S3WH61_PARAO|nr:unnamed protein product [Parnassius apollo]